MAASANNNLDFSASVAGILNEKHSPEHLDAVEEDVFSSLLALLIQLQTELQSADRDAGALESATLQLQLTAECFRAQRNSCVHSARNQKLFRCFDKIMNLLLIFMCFSHPGILVSLMTLRCGIQFLGNLGVGNPSCQDDIWQLSFPGLKTHSELEDLSNCEDFIKYLLISRVLIATQHFLKSAALFPKCYCQKEESLTLRAEIFSKNGENKNKATDNKFIIGYFAVMLLRSDWLNVAPDSFGCNPWQVLQEALTVISLLDVLCEMTSDHKQFMFLQDQPDFLLTTVELLQQVHAIGKASKNIFSAAQNFSSFSEGTHLIRLIGNLCHRNTSNQNKTDNDADGEGWSTDSFVQWAIFTIRNLLENNEQNQELVASLEQRGPVDYSALRELGFLVEERDGSLLLKTVRKDS
uniref:Ataxin 10 n=1 Tax=Oryzias melastigma TaxID=30732 RepID=A0A3B3DJM4_ORYME